MALERSKAVEGLINYWQQKMIKGNPIQGEFAEEVVAAAVGEKK
jgi:hypothetical protein